MSGSNTQIIVAVIALIGVIGGALITNWDKLFPHSQAPASKPTPGFEEKPPTTRLVTPDFRRRAVIEVNAFGDLLPGVFWQGQETYATELLATVGAVTR